jgi:hypothetical protein
MIARPAINFRGLVHGRDVERAAEAQSAIAPSDSIPVVLNRMMASQFNR